MARYIDTDAFDDTVQRLNEQGWSITNIDYKRMDRVLFEMPTADVRENIHAHWIVDFARNGWMDWKCSHCGYTENIDVHVSLDYKFCPMCGAMISERW